jgi:FkbM family methyltransferase
MADGTAKRRRSSPAGKPVACTMNDSLMSVVRQTLPRTVETLQFLAAWLVPWRPAFRTRAAGSGLWFYVHHRDALGRHIAKYGTHEPLVTRWLSRFLDTAPPGIAIDVGANLGWHALHAAIHRNVEAVIAFEPDPFNAWLLERNLAENGIDKAIVETRAVGAAPGVATLHRYRSSNFGRHTLIADHGHGARTVPVTDLDGAIAALGFGERPVSVIKIDVEGYEPAVIAGAARTLARADALILEYSPELSRAGGLSTDDMTARLQAAGFVPFALLSTGGIARIGVDELRGFSGSLDLVWLRGERLAALSAGIDERPRGALTLAEIAEQNKRVKTPL